MSIQKWLPYCEITYDDLERIPGTRKFKPIGGDGSYTLGLDDVAWIYNPKLELPPNFHSHDELMKYLDTFPGEDMK